MTNENDGGELPMKRGIKRKIIIPTTLILICVCACMGLIFKYQMEKDMISTGGQVAEYIANRAITQIDGNLVEKIPENGEGSAPISKKFFSMLILSVFPKRRGLVKRFTSPQFCKSC